MNKKDTVLLTAVIAAMAVEASPFLMAKEKELESLLKNGMVETNPDMREGDTIATRATEKGIAAMNEQTSPTPAASPFAIIKGAKLPTARGGRTSVQYPFDDMEVEDSFFIPASTERPTPAKSLASTVSAATKKFATDTGKTKVTTKGNTIPVLEYTRKFSVKAVKANTAYGSFTAPADGALIQRTA